MNSREVQRKGWLYRRTFKIREAISWMFCGLLTSFTLITTTYTFVNIEAAMDKTAHDLIHKTQDAIIEEIVSYLKPAMHVSQMGGWLFQPLKVNILDNEMLVAYMLGGLRLYPQTDWIYAADTQGNYIAVGNLPEKRVFAYSPDKPLPHKAMYFLEVIDRRQSPLKNFYRYLDADGKVIAEEHNPKAGEDTYDPRKRAWFKRTHALQTANWSEVYIGWNTTNFMITASSPIFNQQGHIAGILAVDVPLERIGDLLSRQKASLSGINFIINDQGKVIGFPEPGRNIFFKDGVPSIKSLRDMNEPALFKAYEMFQMTHQTQFAFSDDNIDFYAYFTPIPDRFASPWVLAMVAPVDDFVGALKAVNRDVLLIVLFLLAAATLFLIFFSHKISFPIETLVEQINRIRDLDIDEEELAGSSLHEISQMEEALTQMKKGLSAFSKFVPRDLVRSLISGGRAAELGGERKVLAIMFSDIANFTAIAESMTTDQLMGQLSEYLSSLSHIILRNKGTIDKYIGDSIMAFWGAPQDDPNKIYHACRAVLLCYRRHVKMNEEWQSAGKPPLPTRFGLHYGEVVVGNVGSSDRLNYTIIGDSVNLASRLEGANKRYGTHILVSEPVYIAMKDKFLMRPVDIVTVKGKEKSIKIYELLAEQVFDGELRPLDHHATLVALTQAAFDCYLNRHWKQALDIYHSLLAKDPTDHLAALYIERCEHYRKNPPPLEWEGVYHLTEK